MAWRLLSTTAALHPRLAELPDGRVHYAPTRAVRQPCSRPPVALIAGTGQTIQSWLGHAQSLAERTDVLQYDCRGQGRLTSLPLDRCDLLQHAEDFQLLVRALRASGELPEDRRLDLVGFSFGGRVAAAVAATAPELVRAVVLTGVPADRGAVGRTALRGWRRSLAAGDLEAFMWQAVLAGHSRRFLTRHEGKLAGWVDSAVRQNRAEAVSAIVNGSHFEDPADPQHSLALVARAAGHGVSGLVIGGELDVLAPPDQVEALAARVGWPCTMIAGAGHSSCIEEPHRWRAAVSDFLDQLDQR